MGVAKATPHPHMVNNTHPVTWKPHYMKIPHDMKTACRSFLFWFGFAVFLLIFGGVGIGDPLPRVILSVLAYRTHVHPRVNTDFHANVKLFLCNGLGVTA